jgi:hypothetical protein
LHNQTGRVCRGVELDPLCIDVIVRRCEAARGETAIPVETGETFADLAQRRIRERADQDAEIDGRGTARASVIRSSRRIIHDRR